MVGSATYFSMNRKRESKLKTELAKAVKRLAPYDDPCEWLKGDFQTPPLPPKEIADFQAKINSAFGAENALVLAWSGDRKYGDAFYTDWHINGLPKGKLERKPVLLFAEEKVNEHDYVYVSCPRWLILEVHHGSELEASWEASSWVEDDSFTGGRKRIRAEKPPQYFYTHLRILAEHDKTLLVNDMPRCCQRMFSQNRICYGRYRLPSDVDVAYVRRIRENMDKAGVAQRNDEKRSEKVLNAAADSTNYFIKRAQQQKALAVQEIMLENYEVFFDDILKDNKLTPHEIRSALKEGFDKQNQERFA